MFGLLDSKLSLDYLDDWGNWSAWLKKVRGLRESLNGFHRNVALKTFTCSVARANRLLFWRSEGLVLLCLTDREQLSIGWWNKCLLKRFNRMLIVCFGLRGAYAQLELGSIFFFWRQPVKIGQLDHAQFIEWFIRWRTFGKRLNKPLRFRKARKKPIDQLNW